MISIYNLSRLQAFGSHLLLSGLIFLILCYLIIKEWYPNVLFDLSGGWQAIVLIIFVDLVIGPFLTLLVFNPTKPDLTRDIKVILCVQMIAIVLGCAAVYQSRPMGIMFLHDRFYIMYPPLIESMGGSDNSSCLDNDQVLHCFYDMEQAVADGKIAGLFAEYLQPLNNNLEKVLPFGKRRNGEVGGVVEREVASKVESGVIFPIEGARIEQRIVITNLNNRLEISKFD